jgi:Lipocalin-like domain
MWKLVVMFLSFAFLPAAAIADDVAKVVGTWKLVSFWNEFQDGSEGRPAYGKNATGYIIFTPEGRMMAIVEAEGRKAAQNDEDRAAAFRSLIAYTGPFRFEGDRFITKVDVSWNPAWVGTEQVRTYALSGDRLQVVSPWVMSPNLGKMTRATVPWERVK